MAAGSAVVYSTAVSTLRCPFLSNRYFFITVRLLERRTKLTEPDFVLLARTFNRARRTAGRNPWQSTLPRDHSEITLTGICSVKYMKRVESVFEIIAEPNRRAILSLLVSSQQSVGTIEHQLRMPQPAVSKHLRVLREAGIVESTVDAQRRLYRLKPERLQEVDVWLAPFRRFWSAHVDALERHLDRMDQLTGTKRATPTKRKTRRRRHGRKTARPPT